ncbi:MAG: DNA-3-methyladenine glycosylase 2 family protein [Acidobacteria bacterium]|nr:DNA-3-methyladenine glycosylase 2 family protein [Acidobacteriota bacterium]
MRKALQHLKSSDRVLRDIIERTGAYRMEYKPADFTSLAQSIVYQQLSGKAASTIFGRFTAAAGDPLLPEKVARMRMPRLRSFGLSTQKATYVVDLARRTLSGEVDFARLPAMADEEVVEHLTRVKGVGEWTAHMFLIFALRRPDVLPVGDLGVRMAMRNAYGLADLPKPAEMMERARPWRPYASVASWYLWRSLDGPGAL